MPKITEGRIEFLPADRNLFTEVSTGITPQSFGNMFTAALTNGDTTQLYKFWEEIAEKDPDVITALDSRTSEITSKEWTIEGPNEAVAEELMKALKEIPGDPSQGLLTVDQLISAFLGSAYLVGISANEIVTDGESIIGFNHIPAHFLTFHDAVNYPKLYTQQVPTGVEFNQDKMIMHYLNPGTDPVRGYLGQAVGWQYAFKVDNLEKRLDWQGRYGKGFLMVTMPADTDSYDAAYSAAQTLVENLYNVDGAVFPAGTEADMVACDGMEGDYFFKSQDDYARNIIRIILGQDSTTSAEDSNRATAEVHHDVLEQRIIQDIELIEDTLTKQLLDKVKQLKSLGDDEYKFKFIVSEMEEDIDNEEASEEAGEDIGTETETSDESAAA